MFIGFSNGTLKAIDLVTNVIEDYPTSAQVGITHLVILKSTLILSANKPGAANTSLILAARLNGYIELIEFSSIFTQLDTLSVCQNAPVVNLSYSGEYILASGQDCVLRVVKLKPTSAASLLAPTINPQSKCLNLMFELSEHGDSPITTMCMDRDNCINAATGSKNGCICVWNLLMGECTQKLNYKKGNSNPQNFIFFI